MLRKLISVVTLCSLLLAIFSARCWMQSETQVGQFTFERTGTSAIRLWSFEGNFIVSRSVVNQPQSAGGGLMAWNSTPRVANGPAPAGLTLASSFSIQSHPLKDDSGVETILILPAWLVTALFAMLPAWWLAKKIRGNGKGKKKPAAA